VIERNVKLSSDQELERAGQAYRAAIELWKLGSEQVHSRLSALLTANSIIIAVSGLAIANKTQIPSELIVALIGGGLLLCLVWGFFVFHGIRLENYYRRKTLEFEAMVIPKDTSLAIRTGNWKFWGYGIGTYATIVVFVAIYSALLYIILMGK
jgi:hypothetical protein